VRFCLFLLASSLTTFGLRGTGRKVRPRRASTSAGGFAQEPRRPGSSRDVPRLFSASTAAATAAAAPAVTAAVDLRAADDGRWLGSDVDVSVVVASVVEPVDGRPFLACFLSQPAVVLELVVAVDSVDVVPAGGSGRGRLAARRGLGLIPRSMAYAPDRMLDLLSNSTGGICCESESIAKWGGGGGGGPGSQVGGRKKSPSRSCKTAKPRGLGPPITAAVVPALKSAPPLPPAPGIAMARSVVAWRPAPDGLTIGR
jgi:hypothetical protein